MNYIGIEPTELQYISVLQNNVVELQSKDLVMEYKPFCRGVHVICFTKDIEHIRKYVIKNICCKLLFHVYPYTKIVYNNLS